MQELIAEMIEAAKAYRLAWEATGAARKKAEELSRAADVANERVSAARKRFNNEVRAAAGWSQEDIENLGKYDV